jgi:uncharacterized damage-inducible protein DinB
MLLDRSARVIAVTRLILADAFEHHVWATLRVIDACQPLTAEQLATTVPGTYGTILDTLRHLVGSDASYLFVLTDGRVSEIEEGELDLAQLRSVMEKNSPEWSSLVGQDLDPEQTVVRHRDDGTDSLAPMGVRLAQVLHHGTDHRSQICTMLTALGIEPPGIDVWDYAETDGRLSVVPTTS